MRTGHCVLMLSKLPAGVRSSAFRVRPSAARRAYHAGFSASATVGGAAASTMALAWWKHHGIVAAEPLESAPVAPKILKAKPRFEGMRVLVTGGAMGIGNGIAEAFAAEGASVIVADITEPPNGSVVKWIRCDASDAKDIEQCCAQSGHIDILVNNVAVQPEAACHEHPLELWNKAIATNLTSYFLFSKYLLPHMLNAGKGVIVNIASVQGLQSQPAIPGYAAAKGGVLSLTRQLGVEYASRGIRVNSVSPGTIATPLVTGILERRGSSAEMAGAVYPMKRIGRIDEIARVVLFLASDEASFIAAENFTVDGGIMGLGGWATVA